MNEAMGRFIKKLESENVKYTVVNDHMLRTVFKCEHVSALQTAVIFDEDCKSVGFRQWSIVTVPADKLAAGYAACNEANDQFRWTRYYLDKDHEVTCGVDAVITPETTGDVCYELMQRMIGITDDAYPIFMKAIWA